MWFNNGLIGFRAMLSKLWHKLETYFKETKHLELIKILENTIDK